MCLERERPDGRRKNEEGRTHTKKGAINARAFAHTGQGPRRRSSAKKPRGNALADSVRLVRAQELLGRRFRRSGPGRRPGGARLAVSSWPFPPALHFRQTFGPACSCRVHAHHHAHPCHRRRIKRASSLRHRSGTVRSPFSSLSRAHSFDIRTPVSSTSHHGLFPLRSQQSFCGGLLRAH